MKRLIVVLCLAVAAGCTDQSGAVQVLTGAGYSQIKITGYKPFSCSKDDAQSTGFEAIGPTGIKVSGSVCSGLIFKNQTIRFN